jgi:opacity protein-like surface antigen
MKLTLALGLVLAGVLATVAFASNSVQQKGDLNHGANPLCSSIGYASVGTLSESSFQLSYKSNGNQLKAKVKLKGALPGTQYELRLIQNLGDCFVTDATFTTNGKGNGKAQRVEGAVSDRAVVFVCRLGACGSDFYASVPNMLHGPATLAPVSSGPAATG